MIRKYFAALGLVALSVFLFAQCGLITAAKGSGSVKGVVRLSDNPAAGHGGVIVYTDNASTVTAADGTFTLEGKFMYETEAFYLGFQKFGYNPQEIQVTVHQNDPVVDVGTITLTKF